MTAVSAELLFDGPIAKEYDMLKLICPAAADMSRRVGEFVAGWNATASRLDILEIGSGTGITTLHLLNSREDVRITGIDNGPAMLEQARRNLAQVLAREPERLRLVDIDALSHLQQLPSASLDIVASAYTVHNFLDDYRTRVLAEIVRVLKPGGVFVNGDRYALDDPAEHLKATQDEVRGYFRTFLAMDRPDLLEQWVVHLFSDESPEHVMPLTQALRIMESVGFAAPTVHFRDGVNALVSGVKPWL